MWRICNVMNHLWRRKTCPIKLSFRTCWTQPMWKSFQKRIRRVSTDSENLRQQHKHIMVNFYIITTDMMVVLFWHQLHRHILKPDNNFHAVLYLLSYTYGSQSYNNQRQLLLVLLCTLRTNLFSSNKEKCNRQSLSLKWYTITLEDLFTSNKEKFNHHSVFKMVHSTLGGTFHIGYSISNSPFSCPSSQPSVGN